MTTAIKEPTRPAGIRDLAHVKAACESWARWCASGRTARAVSMTGRLMAGAGGNVCPGWLDDISRGKGHDPWCPSCHGTGRLPLRLSATSRTVNRVCPLCENDKDARERCHRCRGAGTVTIVSAWVNPAAIRSTRPPGMDWQSWMLDDLITGWRDHDRTFWLNRVVIREYFHNGTQPMKAARLRISESWYKKCLHLAYRNIDAALVERS